MEHLEVNQKQIWQEIIEVLNIILNLTIKK